MEGERLTLSILELAPGAIVPAHDHDAEQVGLLIRGSVRFTVDGEVADLRPGATWRNLSRQPHAVQAGPDGAIVVEAFAPVRRDWDAFPLLDPRPPAWPGPG